MQIFLIKNSHPLLFKLNGWAMFISQLVMNFILGQVNNPAYCVTQFNSPLIFEEIVHW